MRRRARAIFGALVLLAVTACGAPRAPARAPALTAGAPRVHGVWVWKTRELLDDGAPLASACRAAGANEVYLAVTRDLLADPRLSVLVMRLHADGLRVEALMGDPSWSKAEKWPAMLALIDDVIAYDRRSSAPFAAVHLDVEPHALPENRGADVHTYLPTYVDGLRRARARAEGGGLSLSADVPRKFLFASEGDRRALAGAVPRLFLMLYELPRHGRPAEDASQELARTSSSSLRAAYDGDETAIAGKMIVGLSVDDYGSRLAVMLDALDTANGANARYAGWAIHDFSQYAALHAQGR